MLSRLKRRQQNKDPIMVILSRVLISLMSRLVPRKPLRSSETSRSKATMSSPITSSSHLKSKMRLEVRLIKLIASVRKYLPCESNV